MQFPNSDIWTLLDGVSELKYNMGESTCKDLTLADVCDPAELKDFQLGYGSSRGDLELRKLIAVDNSGWWSGALGPDDVLITTGAAASLALINQLLVGKGDHAVVVTPCFPPTLDVLTAIGV
jgi:DNA-binding transcriptional MocR family regulator